MRDSLLAVAVCLSLSGCDSGPPPAALAVPIDRMFPMKEIPPDWVLADIVDAMPPRRDHGPTHVLAWRRPGDDTKRGGLCLAVKQLEMPTEAGERWVLASLARNSLNEDRWEFVTIWLTPDPELKSPPFIMDIRKYRERPTGPTSTPS